MEENKISIKDNTFQWREIRPKVKISRRSYCTACIYNNKLYAYGGVDIGEEQLGNLNSIIIDDIMPSWHQEPISGAGVPTSISRHAAVLVSNKWFISGGEYHSDSSNKVFSINLDTLEVTMYTIQGDILPKIDSHTMNYIEDGTNKLLVLIGGFQNNSKANKVYTLDYSEKNRSLNCKYIKSIGTEPSARSNHSSIAFKSAIYLFGGINEDGGRLNDLWKWKEGKWEEIKAAHSPVGRGCHSAVEHNGIMYIFGGQELIGRERNDVHCYNISENKWAELFINCEQPKLDLSPSSPTKKSETKYQYYSPTTNVIKPSKPINHNIFNMLQEHTLFNISPKHTIHLKKSHSPSRPDFSPNKTMFTNHDPYKSLSFRNTGMEFSSTKTKNIPSDSNLSCRNYNFKTMTVSNDISFSKDAPKAESRIRVFDRVIEPMYGIADGKYPCSRDGHAACILESSMVIFGGDRNKVSFNDIYLFNLNGSK